MNQHWTCLYVYWFGLLLKPLHPNLASIHWVHTLNIPVKLMEIKAIIQNNIKDDKIWNLNIKLLYAYLIEKVNHKSKMEKQFPQVHWNTVWRTLSVFKNADMQSCLYRYIFNVLPTGEYLMKFKVVDKIPKRLQCGKGTFTVEYIFHECEDFHDAREYLQQDIKELDSQVLVDNTLLKFGNKKLTDHTLDKKICKLVFEHIYHIWHNIKKPW